MSSSPLVSIVVPTYNERDNLSCLAGKLFSALKAEGIRGELIVVDDNSPDGTADLARDLSRRYPIRVVVRPGKNGLSSAVIEGWRVAKGEILGVMDADMSHPPEAIPRILRPILQKRSDISLGSRHVRGGRDEGLSPHRKLVSQGASLIARPLVPVKDPMSGLIFFRRQVIQGVHLNPMGFKIALEVLVKGTYDVVTEVPYVFNKRLNGESKLQGKEYVNYLRHVARLYGYSYPAHRALRPLAASFSFIVANLAVMYLAVEVGRVGYIVGGTLAFLAALAFLVGHINPHPWDGDTAGFLRSFVAASLLAFGLDMGVLAYIVLHAGFPYTMGALLADTTVVAPLLITAAFRGLPGISSAKASQRAVFLQGR